MAKNFRGLYEIEAVELLGDVLLEKEEYFWRVGITRTAPKTLMFIDDMAKVSGGILLTILFYRYFPHNGEGYREIG